jgi:hypothetical protein
MANRQRRRRGGRYNRGQYQIDRQREMKKFTIWSNDVRELIIKLLGIDIPIQAFIFSVFVYLKRCHIWPLPCIFSALVSFAIFLAIARKLQLKWKMVNEVQPIQEDTAMDIESQLTQSAVSGRLWEISFVLFFILISTMVAASF